MENFCLKILVEDTRSLILIACLILPFIINTIIFIFVQKDNTKVITANIILIPFILSLNLLIDDYLVSKNMTFNLVWFFLILSITLIYGITTYCFSEALLKVIEWLKTKSFAEDSVRVYSNKTNDDTFEKGIQRTIKRCLRCGAVLSEEKCKECKFDYTKTPVLFLVKENSKK